MSESFEAIFFWKLYNFDNFIRGRISDHKKITFAHRSPKLEIWASASIGIVA